MIRVGHTPANRHKKPEMIAAQYSAHVHGMIVFSNLSLAAYPVEDFSSKADINSRKVDYSRAPMHTKKQSIADSGIFNTKEVIYKSCTVEE